MEEDRVREALRRVGGRVASPGDAEYPEKLRREASAPRVVYLAGPWDHDGPAVAIVGARDADGDGCDFARELAAGLARRGIPVVSGLARGIDAHAHLGALEAGGRSGAVLGTSLTRCYPAEHRDLQDSLARSLGLMTEVPPAAAATRSTFAARNHLLALISDAVVVVQGRESSGTRLTATAARALGRPLGAVPWDPRVPLAATPLQLLRSGAARLIRDADDVIALLPNEGAKTRPLADAPGAPVRPKDEPRSAPAALEEREARLLGVLRRLPQSLDRVAERAGLPSADAAAGLVRLELLGYAERAPGGAVRLTRRD